MSVTNAPALIAPLLIPLMLIRTRMTIAAEKVISCSELDMEFIMRIRSTLFMRFLACFFIAPSAVSFFPKRAMAPAEFMPSSIRADSVRRSCISFWDASLFSFAIRSVSDK